MGREVPRTAANGRLSSWAWAGWSLGAFALLAACVALRLPDAVDRSVFAAARPRGVWGPGQNRWLVVAETFRPPVAASVLAVVALSVSVVRRSLRPALLVVATGVATAAATLTGKLALARPDPQVTGAGHAGSFPSGHTVAAVVCLGLAVHLILPGTRRWARLVGGAAGAVMGVALVAIGAHWASDVLGGLLLGLGVLSGAIAADGRKPAAGVPVAPGKVSGRPASQA